MILSKNIVLIVVVIAALAAGTLLVAGYADKPQAAAPADCTMKCEKCPLPSDAACCQGAKPDGCPRPNACAEADAEKPCARPSASCCPSEAALATPEAESAPTGCPMGGCPRAQ